MDARTGACLGTIRAGDGDQAEGLARRWRRNRRLEFRSLEQHPFNAAGRRRIDAGGAAYGATIRGARGQAHSIAGRPRRPQRDRGYGFAFARYKNLAAYCAIASEVEVERETGRPRLVRAVAAVDSGQVVNPDGLINQIEGAIVQSMSWTLYESVTFDNTRITS